MKLYATISNGGQLTVGKGDNENLTISLNRGNRRMVEFYYTIEDLGDGNELVVIDMLNLSDGSTTRVIEHEGEKSLPEYKTGEMQKGEDEEDSNYGKANPSSDEYKQAVALEL